MSAPVRGSRPGPALAARALAALALVGASACGALRREVDSDAVARLRRGVHTEALAIELLGRRPDGRFVNPDGTAVLRWRSGIRDPRSGRNDSLVLHFDARGVLARIQRTEDVRGYEPGRSR